MSALVKNTSSSVLNNISGSSASLSSLAGPSAGALGGAINQATAGLDVASLSAKVSAGTSSLTSLVSSGLPPSAAASLAAAFNSLDSGGSLPIKLPTVATNTTDRSELSSQITSVLGNKKIPAPNFGGNISTETNPELARLNDLVDQQLKLLKELEDQIIVVDEARVAFLEATNNLPQGDEEIETLKVAYRTELDKKLAIEQKMSNNASQASTNLGTGRTLGGASVTGIGSSQG